MSSVCAPEIEMAFISTGFLVSEGENKKIFVLTANGWIWIYEGNSHYLLKFMYFCVDLVSGWKKLSLKISRKARIGSKLLVFPTIR